MCNYQVMVVALKVILLLLHQVKVNLCLPLQLLLNQVVLLQVFLLQAIPAQFLLKNAASVTPTPVEAQRTNSLSDKFKGWGRKLSKKDKSKDVNSAAGETTAETGVIAKDDDKPVGGITALDAEKTLLLLEMLNQLEELQL